MKRRAARPGTHLAIVLLSSFSLLCACENALILNEAPVTCGSWLERYIVWHKEHRSSPDSRYLIYNCHKSTRSCSGTGDRIRAILFLLRVAAANDMVLLVNWDLRSVNLLSFLVPADIDWSLASDPTLSALLTQAMPPHAEALFAQLFDPGPVQGQAPAAHLVEAFRRLPLVRVISFQHLEMPFHGQLEAVSPTSGPGADMADFYTKYACMFRAMFRPSAAVQASAEARTRQLYQQYPVPYVAWHLRAGGQVGEEQHMNHLIPGHSRLSQIMYGIICAEELAAAFSLSTHTTPVLFSTDFNPLRKFSVDGVFTMLTSPNFTAHHFDYDLLATHDDVSNVFVDLLLLARARCILTHVSGFSHIAVAWAGALSGRLCWTELVTCIQANPRAFGGITI